jgi:hypothetical protein
MRWRVAHALVLLTALAGCLPRVPRVDMSGMTLPKFEIFRYGVADPDVPTTPYRLTPENVVDVKAGLSAAFTDGRTLTFGPIGARRRDDGSLAICGLVSVRKLDASETGMKLFDGTGTFDDFGAMRFRPGRLAGANARFLDVYGDCRDLGVI